MTPIDFQVTRTEIRLFYTRSKKTLPYVILLMGGLRAELAQKIRTLVLLREPLPADDDGSGSKNEPSSIAENNSSSSYCGFKMSTKGLSVRVEYIAFYCVCVTAAELSSNVEMEEEENGNDDQENEIEEMLIAGHHGTE
ncbi:hypothetical protein DPMN_134919 [Dreissena polymorpha]|uniref:Uncharacterized protein n=1 Tax=Dreissena polymorpha TaxID=45954 RepID=A0A9D4FY72_DREPO|nr:hypothetical protein DPMN_134919 [Dreissena polymorpha]